MAENPKESPRFRYGNLLPSSHAPDSDIEPVSSTKCTNHWANRICDNGDCVYFEVNEKELVDLFIECEKWRNVCLIWNREYGRDFSAKEICGRIPYMEGEYVSVCLIWNREVPGSVPNMVEDISAGLQ
ncbi:hypothetical protein DPMN_164554 [Dreissena polymorpha]|uniref:Uncharacterized protein n=1 Tax=Dreissena polymorpha TaxID=45954 RepID=A0A9D4EUF6_DREPO|nr:hypothetical protein DPMN_164554 [Dreissena polymorpha]